MPPSPYPAFPHLGPLFLAAFAARHAERKNRTDNISYKSQEFQIFLVKRFYGSQVASLVETRKLMVDMVTSPDGMGAPNGEIKKIAVAAREILKKLVQDRMRFDQDWVTPEDVQESLAEPEPEKVEEVKKLVTMAERECRLFEQWLGEYEEFLEEMGEQDED